MGLFEASSTRRLLLLIAEGFCPQFQALYVRTQLNFVKSTALSISSTRKPMKPKTIIILIIRSWLQYFRRPRLLSS
ncbi:Uncharacterized protein HZ326_19661 [Fusarium oxysporum f. sp. albedinis]|nr:Uncharacterized protein HZ326_19661 [Fusarium oxysporum f. sp. albedinis]